MTGISPSAAGELVTAIVLPLAFACVSDVRGAHVYTSWFAIGLGALAVLVWVMISYGLVTLIVALYVVYVLNTFPITFDLQAWYADLSLCALAVVTALAIYGFVTARSGPIAR